LVRGPLPRLSTLVPPCQWRFWNEKTRGVHCGAKEKSRGANINVSPA